MTAQVLISNSRTGISSKVDALIDPGSTLNLMEESMVKELWLQSTHTREFAINAITASQASTTRKFSTAKLHTNDGTINVSFMQIPSIMEQPILMAPLPQEDIEFMNKHKLTLADSKPPNTPFKPRILIGVAHAHELILEGKLILPSGFHLIPSKLGFIASGAIPHPPQLPQPREPREHIALLTAHEQSNVDKQLARFLALDNVGREVETTEKEERARADNEVNEHFLKSIKHTGERYQVRLCTKANLPQLPDNYKMALSRLNGTLRSLDKSPKYKEAYHSIIQEQLASAKIELVDPDVPTTEKCHYIPHQAVIRPEKTSTPVRIVYDASAKTKGAISLNDTLFTGENLMEKIPSVLLRARSQKYIVIADVAKAFLQVEVAEDQRDLMRFLWVRDPNKPPSKNNIVTYRFKVTPFGLGQSPFMLNKVLQYHLSHCILKNPEDKALLEQIMRNLYVDNVVMGSNSISPNMYKSSKEAFTTAGMNLRSYVSNDLSFQDSIPLADRGSHEPQSLLGLKWCPQTDLIQISIHVEADVKTKRKVLSQIASVYDPLGLIAPFTLSSRLFMQSLWELKQGWDDEMPLTWSTKWNSIANDMNKFAFSIPRYTNLSMQNTVHLVVFTDASAKAMGAAIYAYDEQRGPTLLISRTRLVSVKQKPTIPKLELEAAVIGTQMAVNVLKDIKPELEGKHIHLYQYTDSSTVLFWIQDEHQYKLGPYVANRLRKLREAHSQLMAMPDTKVHPLRFVRTADNSADMLTRGLSSKDTECSQWWKGPPWLSQHPEQWPQDTLPPGHRPQSCETPMEHVTALTHTTPCEPPIIDLSRFSTLKRALNVVSYIGRFIIKIKRKQTTFSPSISNDERSQALKVLIRMIQRSIKSDSSLVKQGLITIDKDSIWKGNKNRLGNAEASPSFTTPVYLPHSEGKQLVRLMAEQIHRDLHHAGTNTTLNELKVKFWAPKARARVKSVIQNCVVCRKAQAVPCAYPGAPDLPVERVQPYRAFENCGLDFFGPYQFVDSQEKRYVLLFTCLSTRCVHLELVQNMSIHSFLNAFRRFTARRGVPVNIVSDKAPTFTLASTLLKNCREEHLEKELVNTLFPNHTVQWKFTVAHAPWQGGVYERLVGSCKMALTKSIGRRKLSNDDFSAILAEVEATVNSRPLSYVPSDDEKEIPEVILRPIDLILPHTFMSVPFLHMDTDEYKPPSELNTNDRVMNWLRTREQIINTFWELWRKQHLLSLRDRDHSNQLTKGKSNPCTLRVGDIVLVADENTSIPRSAWPLARITHIEGTLIKLKATTGRIIERPVNRIIPLEIHSSLTEPNPNPQTPPSHPMQTRSKTMTHQ